MEECLDIWAKYGIGKFIFIKNNIWIHLIVIVALLAFLSSEIEEHTYDDEVKSD